MAAAKLQVTFAPLKPTTNMIRFAEVTDAEDMLAVARIGSLYIPKRTLQDIGWSGENLTVTVA